MIRTLRQQQSLFALLLAQLIVWINGNEGWTVTLGDGYRGDQKSHMAGSLHYIRLAQDLNLFVDGVWITDDHPVWRIIGAHWQALDPEAAWGGNFTERDWNHFSLKWGGKQ